MNKNQYSLTEKPKILIVDDKPENIFALEDVLSGLDVEMVKAANGNDALKAVLNQSFALAILDVQMPEMDGYELAKLIRTKKEISHIPIIFLSAVYSDKLHIFKGYKSGAIDFLTKPYSPEILIGKVKIFLEQYKYKNKLEILVNELNESNKKLEFEISEHKKAEEQILKLSRAVEQSPNIVLITNTEGNIEYVNPKFIQLTGYSLEEVIGKTPRILKSGSMPPEVYKELWKTITSGNEWRGEFCNKKKTGERYWESASISAIKNAEGTIINFIAVKEDITEKMKMKEALIQSEKLKSIGIITAGISHEFNNILAIISGNVQLLEASYKDKNHEELMDSLRTIKMATDDGAEISSKMIKFTKTDKDTTGFVRFYVEDLINQAIDFTMPRWKNMAQAKGINYHMDTEGMKRVPYIWCNLTELKEVFVNIINNALDAMPGDGRISFSTWSEENTVFISISDTGKGMPEATKKKIFDPFFTTRRPEGTGLGLSTAYGIITGHGGKIEVESEIDKGATFTLQFPAAVKADCPKESPEPKHDSEINSLLILVVDDEEEICDILDKFLSKKGHLVKTVDNGREAIILTKAVDYDLVLCDMAMPDVFGYDVIKALNKSEKRPKIGIITGWGEKLKPIDDEDFKVDFIIKKPFSLSELEKHIDDVISA